MGQLSKIEPELVELGYRILAVSMDRPEKLRESYDRKGYAYKLLSDSKAEAVRAFGLAFRVDDKAFKALEGYGIDIEDASGETHRILPVPAVYIVDTEGNIRFHYVNPQYTVRLPPDELLEAAREHR